MDFKLECPAEAPRNPLKVALGVFLIGGIVVSFLPQHVKLVRLRSSEGLSPLFLLFAGIAGTSTLFNVWILQAQTSLRCCHVWSPAYCFENILGIVQVSVQWATLYAVIALFLACFPADKKWGAGQKVQSERGEGVLAEGGHWNAEELGRSVIDEINEIDEVKDDNIPPPSPPPPPLASSDLSESEAADSEQTRLLSTRQRPSNLQRNNNGYPPPVLRNPSPSAAYFRALAVTSILAIYFILTFALSLLMLSLDAQQTGSASATVFASLLGIISTLFSAVQFLPQIIHTWRERKIGALSVGMLAMQAPGSFLFVWSLTLQPGVNMCVPFLVPSLHEIQLVLTPR